MKASFCFVGVALATPLEIFRDVREKTYAQIESKLSSYRNMMEKQIPNEDFKLSFELCSESNNDFVTSESLASCLPESLLLEDDDSRRRFIFKSWESVDQDSDEKLDFIEWKSYLFALGFVNFEVIKFGFGTQESDQFTLNHADTASLLDYAHAWLASRASKADRISFDNIFKSIDIDGDVENLTHVESIRLFLAVFTEFLQK